MVLSLGWTARLGMRAGEILRLRPESGRRIGIKDTKGRDKGIISQVGVPGTDRKRLGRRFNGEDTLIKT